MSYCMGECAIEYGSQYTTHNEQLSICIRIRNFSANTRSAASSLLSTYICKSFVSLDDVINNFFKPLTSHH